MRASLLPLVATFLCLPVAALSQGIISGNIITGEPCAGTLVGGGATYGPGNQKGAPFTGVARSTTEQRLYDGNIIHSQIEVRQARDSAGRILQEREMSCQMGQDGQMHERFTVTVQDVANRTITNWTAGDGFASKVATVIHLPMPTAINRSPATEPTLTPEEQAAAAERRSLAQTRAAENRRNEIGRLNRLGTKAIHGIEATGTRTTQTIPTGEAGNDMPLLITTEIWRSRTLGLTLLAIQDDPRRGKSTFEYTQLTPGEPDPATFAPPSDYKIVDQHPGSGISGAVGPAILEAAPPPPRP